VTVFGVLFTPVFYYVIRWFGERRKTTKTPSPPSHTGHAESEGNAHAQSMEPVGGHA